MKANAINPSVEQSDTSTLHEVHISTPSRLCLFGEHLDYLDLEVIACAINLRFSATIRWQDRLPDVGNTPHRIDIRIRDSRIDTLGEKNTSLAYEHETIDLDQPIVYRNKRDYLRSATAVLLRQGVRVPDCSIVMDSDIPIGKGMCSSSTMIVVYIKALLEAARHNARNDPDTIAHWAYLAEVDEFGEPGGMMDHYTSAIGGLLNLDFAGGRTAAKRIDAHLTGCFILFDSLEQKNTTVVLAGAKTPALRAMDAVRKDIRTIVRENAAAAVPSTAAAAAVPSSAAAVAADSSAAAAAVPSLVLTDATTDSLSTAAQNLSDVLMPDRFDFEGAALDAQAETVLRSDCSSYSILLKAKELLTAGSIDNRQFGRLITLHHNNLRDGLGISTPRIEQILDIAIANGAHGGKINGSGGGGCCFVYAEEQDAGRILDAVRTAGYPGQVLWPDTGVRVEEEKVKV